MRIALTRRLRGALAAALLATGAAAHAGAPMAKTAPPGFYRLMLGDFEVTALFDGAIDLKPSELLKGLPPAQVKQRLAQAYQTEPVPTSVNAYLVNTGTKLVMIDAGTGSLAGPALGTLVANLKASGYQPEQVDEIYITHLHYDHVGGITQGDQAVFPNAIVRADRRDAEFWLSEQALAQAPGGLKTFMQHAINSMKPYVASQRFKPFDGDTELVPGVKAIATHGHTPGHTIYQVESKGQKLVLWGDLMHVAAVQFAQPFVAMAFDADAKRATAQRQKAFADAAKQGYLIGASHLPFPGIGRLRTDGKGYDFLPVHYVPVK